MGTRKTTPLRQQAADALRRARRLPVGQDRNDLRQLAINLLDLERRGIDPKLGIILSLHEQDSMWFPDARYLSPRE